MSPCLFALLACFACGVEGFRRFVSTESVKQGSKLSASSYWSSKSTAQQKPIILLDFDHVINDPCIEYNMRSTWKDIVTVECPKLGEYVKQVTYSPTVVNTINKWSTKADVRWLTTWPEESLDLFADIVGLMDFPLLSDIKYDWGEDVCSWKEQIMENFVDDVDPDRLIIWIDPDLGDELPICGGNIQGYAKVRPNTIYLAPLYGLKKHHLKLVKKYLSHPEQATGQSIYDLKGVDGGGFVQFKRTFSFGGKNKPAFPPSSVEAVAPSASASASPWPEEAAASSGSTTIIESPTNTISVNDALEKISNMGGEENLINAIKGTVITDCAETFPTFASIAGQTLAKQLLKEAVLLPILMPQIFTGLREPWKGILLFGPPGTGKTMLAKAVASASSTGTRGQNTIFFSCTPSSCSSKWLGESEKLIKCLFDAARLVAPSVIFMDEVDALLSQRSDSTDETYRLMKNEFFAQMDGLQQPGNGGNVLVLASTNTPWDLDGAALRRLEKRVYVPLPDDLARKEQFKLAIRKNIKPGDLGEDEQSLLTRLANLSNGLSGADIKIVCKEAAMAPVRRMLAEISIEELQMHTNPAGLFTEMTIGDLEEAVSRVRPSVNGKSAARFEEWNRDFGASG